MTGVNGVVLNYVIAAGFLGTFSLMLKLSRDTRVEQDKKISRVYRRLDENKEDAEKKFTMSVVCDEKHTHITESLIRIEKNVDFLVRKKNGKKK